MLSDLTYADLLDERDTLRVQVRNLEAMPGAPEPMVAEVRRYLADVEKAVTERSEEAKGLV